ncbi:thioredoxin domain-containing protein [Micromonospora sp. WMMD1102]|uniref:DsbA family protein n=1 Tax=Micromonospora sp. WMMD1102 TaxID=3016105 RepID=UPI002415527B|nr:thioredoxin domain-containing protein [Micromonospora sp. WMMD1102]MDG4785022.1 thioredoxin domain-containing protein [Micromonospora sp. WMMD1102]
MSGNTKITLGFLAVILVGLTVLLVVVRNTEDGAGQAAAERLVRADSHRLTSAPDDRVTVVEFLDYECPSCGAAYPGVEQLRAEYADRITYVIRNFPLDSHANAENAARAAEAAARQDKFEEMYRRLFETQQSWGGKQESLQPVFEEHARAIGLDLARYQADLTDPAIAERIRVDREDGIAVGVQGTPTFFVNGERFEGQPTYAGLKAAVDAALAK